MQAERTVEGREKDTYIEEVFKDHDKRIVVVCMHGVTRSKAVAKLLRENFGYSNACALGIKDNHTSKQDKLQQCDDADLVVVLQSDILSEVRHLTQSLAGDKQEALKRKLLEFPLENLEHHALSSDPGMRFKRDEALAKIDGRLEEIGFKKRG